jgi:cyclase
MSLAIRIIPSLLIRGRELVKGIGFDAWRSVGIAEQAARIHALRGVDELLLLDITATREGRGPDLNIIEQLSKTGFMPLSVGGGVRSVEDALGLLQAGADKVVIGSGFYEVNYLVTDCAQCFGRQAVVVSLDVKRGTWWVRSGTRDTGINIGEAAQQAYDMGAGEVLLTSIDLDGTMAGYDLFTLTRICKLLTIPVIACGGCSGYEDMARAVKAGASAVAAGALFQFTDVVPLDCSRFLAANGVETRV